MFDSKQPINRFTFLRVATIFEGGLVVVAYLIGWFADVDPLADFHLRAEAVAWGLAGTIPLYGFFVVCYRIPYGNLQAIKRLLIDRMGPMLDVCHWSGLLYLGLLAGFTEEILFRGLLQPLLESHWGWLVGLILSNVLFAMAHFITPLYALLAGLTGIYLGWTLDVGGERNLLTPVVIHATYDFLAFQAVVQTYRAERGMAF